MRLTSIFLFGLILGGAAPSQEFVSGRFIVELEEPGKGSGRDAAANARQVVRAAVEERAGVVRDSLERVINALVVEIDDARMAELQALPGVRKVYRDRKGQLDMDHAINLVRARDAWRAAGGQDQAGRGMKIAIVDTGIDVSHPAFQDDSLALPAGFPKTSRDSDASGTNRKVIVARSYGTKGPADIRDLIGHGTAVASVAAGTLHSAPVGEFAGIAPKAFLGIYRLDESDGSFTASGVLRALEDASRDEMDVLNMSLGFFPPARFDDDPVAQAVERLAARTIVTKSAGNSGPEPGLATAPNSPSAITVGASWNDRVLGPTVEVPGLGSVIATRPDVDLPAEPMNGELADADKSDPSGLLCLPPSDGAFGGKIMLILRGDCLFETKVLNAAKAGAKGAIIYTNNNPVAALWSVGTGTLPVVMISNAAGVALKKAMAAEPGLAVKISFDLGAVGIDANQVSSFSSRGPGTAANVHVDLVAPGEEIYLAAQKGNAGAQIHSATGYAVEAGTSFSSPMVAGAAAVLKAARPGLTVKQYKSLLVNSAAGFARSNGTPFGVQSAGAGRLDVYRALRAMTAVEPVSVSFGSGGMTPDVSRDIRLTNLSGADDTVSIAVSPIAGSVAAIVTPATVALRAGESRVVTVRLSSGGALAPGEHQGFLLIQGTQSDVEMRVAYWYGASDKVAKTISLLSRTTTPKAGERYQYLMRMSDAAGTAVIDKQPAIEVTAGEGRVESVQSLDDTYPGMWLVTLRLGLVSGVRNAFQFKLDDAVRTVSMQP